MLDLLNYLILIILKIWV